MRASASRALVVGADRVDAIRAELEQAAHLGVTRTEHWSGRQVGDNRRQIPGDTRLVVVLCDRINHDLLYSVRRQAASRGLPVVYCRHSLVDMRDKLARFVVPAEADCIAVDCPVRKDKRRARH
ncbi:DUF2325 domain-containing protein [Azoarcus olearius]|uniref:DUF2325 domain-containing protein n=1 Tax=Azoarcus sp. (strain BH72) TaxID=418699 RepID=A1K852_AZOSB|nr:DUF2325 domain-containing protein [Azoarcus olearius]ANQ85564.1 hypothetical protein dqs_2534 [Azoarcus olearius]CAL95007.1 conserved hypothetical protein [Azoarcus olearius]